MVYSGNRGIICWPEFQYGSGLTYYGNPVSTIEPYLMGLSSARSEKQIFIAIDKLSSYDDKAAQIINKHKVLQLSKDKLLFMVIIAKMRAIINIITLIKIVSYWDNCNIKYK